MNSNQSMELAARLERQFDAESVELALKEIGTNRFTSWFLRPLRTGRGAIMLMPKIEHELKQKIEREPSIQTILSASTILSEEELQAALSVVAVPSEAEIVDQVCSGRFPPLKILSQERRLKLYARLRGLVSLSEYSEQSGIILDYLLCFDRVDSRFASAESRRLATEWSIRFHQYTGIQTVLRHLLWMEPGNELTDIAERHLDRNEWTTASTMLMTSLMHQTRKKQNQRWIQNWYNEAEPSKLDGYVVAEFVKTSGCSRRAFDMAKQAILGHCDGAYWVLLALIENSNRKFVDRWLRRAVKTNLRFWTVQEAIPNLLRTRPTKRNRDLALLAIQLLGTTGSHKILLELVMCSKNSEVIGYAKRQIADFPNAPDSFTLMRCIAKAEPGLAIPWLLEWNRTALPEQVCAGLQTIVRYSDVPEHLILARKFLNEQSADVKSWCRAQLASALLKKAPTFENLALANGILDEKKHDPHPDVRRLSKLVRRVEQLLKS